MRQLGFDTLAHIQRQYRTKKKSLIQLYVVALKYPNWLLRSSILHLICLALAKDSKSNTLDISARDLILSVAVLLDDDAIRVRE